MITGGRIVIRGGPKKILKVSNENLKRGSPRGGGKCRMECVKKNLKKAITGILKNLGH